MDKWCVYMHENRENGKKYIGVTSQKPTSRWRNGAGYVGNARFYNAIKKYGWDGFRHEILYDGLTRAEAQWLEAALITEHGAQDPKKGYNVAPGGFAPTAAASTRRRMSAAQCALWSNPEYRERMQLARAGHPVSAETRRKISQANAGHPVSETARQRMSENHANVSGARNPRARAVICMDTGARYSTAKEAAETCGTHKSDIAKCCKGKLKTAGGYRWRYYIEDIQGGTVPVSI